MNGYLLLKLATGVQSPSEPKSKKSVVGNVAGGGALGLVGGVAAGLGITLRELRKNPDLLEEANRMGPDKFSKTVAGKRMIKRGKWGRIGLGVGAVAGGARAMFGD